MLRFLLGLFSIYEIDLFSIYSRLWWIGRDGEAQNPFFYFSRDATLVSSPAADQNPPVSFSISSLSLSMVFGVSLVLGVALNAVVVAAFARRRGFRSQISNRWLTIFIVWVWNRKIEMGEKWDRISRHGLAAWGIEEMQNLVIQRKELIQCTRVQRV